MQPPLAFQHLCHADWSTDAKKRWVARATRAGSGWRVAAPALVGNTAGFVSRVVAEGSVLAGFDFPIGVPAAYGALTGLTDFPAALHAFGWGAWADFYRVADLPEDVSIRRPFYPRGSRRGVTRLGLLAGLGLADAAALMRRCDRATATRRAACPMFWTLGPSQVGKAAITGWREVVAPGLAQGARLWPYDGSLADLARLGTPVLAETYPAEAYAHSGIALTRAMSKRRQADRRSAAACLAGWAEKWNIRFTPDLTASIADGFGPRADGEDAFDALAGLLGMIEVADGRRAEHPADRDETERWEGWILGQCA